MATTVAQKQPSVWEDFVDIFISPAQVFLRRRGGGFLVPLVVLTVITGALAIGTKPLLQPVYDAVWSQTSEQIRKQKPNVTEAELSKIRDMQEKLAPMGAVVGLPIMIILLGFAVWLVGKLFDSQLTVGDGMMVATYASFPKILAFVAAPLLVMLIDPSKITSVYSATLGPGFFVDAMEAPVLAALVGRLDLFTIWVTVLLGVGLHVAGRVPKGQASAAAAIIWLLGALPGLWGAIRQG
jgi:hypothetical protein